MPDESSSLAYRVYESSSKRWMRNVDNLLFFIAFCLWMMMWIGRRTIYESYFSQFISYDAVRLICFNLLGIRELFFSRHDKQSYVGLVVSLWLASTINNSFNELFDCVWFVFAARDIPFRRIAAFSLITIVVMLLLVIGVSIVSGTADSVFGRNQFGIVRYGLWFNNPNKVPAIYVYVFSLWCYLRGEDFGIIDAIGGAVLTAIIYFFTGSRSFLLLIGMLIPLMFIIGRISKKYMSGSIAKATLVYFLPFGACVWFLFSMYFDISIPWMASLDRILSGRLLANYRAIHELGVRCFGQQLYFGGDFFIRNTGEYASTLGKKIPYDSMFIKIPVLCGFACTVALLSLCTAALCRLYRKEEYRLLAILFVLIVFGFSECTSAQLSYNPFLLLVGNLLMPANMDMDIAKPASSTLSTSPKGKHAQIELDVARLDKM